jgi:DNA repair protein RadC
MNFDCDNKKKNLHVGHRKKMKKRFLNEGLDLMEDHNILELLLFYAISQKDTNPLAHELIDRFGSFSGVLDADMRALCDVPGISEHTATFLKIIPAAARKYFTEKTSQPDKIYDSVGKIGEFLVSKFVGSNVEEVYILLFDNRYALVDMKKIATGSVSSVDIPQRQLIELALSSKAAMAVIAHNHPSGLAIPSQEDTMVTESLRASLGMVDVELIEHIIVAGAQYVPVMLKSKNYLYHPVRNRDSFYRDYLG